MFSGFRPPRYVGFKEQYGSLTPTERRRVQDQYLPYNQLFHEEAVGSVTRPSTKENRLLASHLIKVWNQSSATD